MQSNEYLMESDEETLRLDVKTNVEVIRKQALWAGIKAGMRVADVSCGSGKTTHILHELVQPGGEVIGVDSSEERLEYANKHYGGKGIEFRYRDILKPLNDLGKFDFIWVRFVLEYYLSEGFDIVENISKILKPGGILCLIDLDHNCLNYFGISEKLERTLQSIMESLQKEVNFDPFMGRKLYSFLYDLGYQDINVDVDAHHIIFGKLNETDAFNWMKKAEVAPKKINYRFEEYEGGYEEFLEEYKKFFSDPRRFIYTPVISCRGQKPVAE